MIARCRVIAHIGWSLTPASSLRIGPDVVLLKDSSEAGAKCPILRRMKKARSTKAAPARTTVRTPDDSLEKRRARGKRIHWAREIIEPNRLDFARKLGVDVSTIRNIETGKANPGIQLAQRIFHALRISLDYVVEGRLSGVDPDLAATLVADHPELRPPRPVARAGSSPSTAPQPNTYSTVTAAPHFS